MALLTDLSSGQSRGKSQLTQELINALNSVEQLISKQASLAFQDPECHASKTFCNRNSRAHTKDRNAEIVLQTALVDATIDK